MISDETFIRVRALHRVSRPRACCSPLRHKATRQGIPRTKRIEPKQTGAEAQAETQETFRFGPRFKVLVEIRFFTHLAGDFSKGQALANDPRSEFAEAVTVVHIVPVIEAECLLVDIAEQMERLDRNVSTAHGAFEQAPEVLQAVCVAVPVHVFFGVIHHFVNVPPVKTPAIPELIGVDH